MVYSSLSFHDGISILVRVILQSMNMVSKMCLHLARSGTAAAAASLFKVQISVQVQKICPENNRKLAVAEVSTNDNISFHKQLYV